MVESDLEYVSPDQSLYQKETAPDHILLIIIDALRPEQQLDVNLDFCTGVAAGTWTFPSVTSIATGQRPSDHGSVAHTSSSDEEYAMPKQTDSHFHLPQDLDAAGYDTYGGFAFMTPFLALQGAFQTHKLYEDAPAETVLNGYRSWRESRDSTFGYLHLGDLHAPVEPPREYIESYNVDTSLRELSEIRAFKTDFDPADEDCQYYRDNKLRLYRAASGYVTDQLSPLISKIQDDTAIVLAGDHGESHWEHQHLDQQITDSRPNYCFGHGGTPFDKLARVPIGVSEQVPTPTGGWASLRDIGPTLVNFAVADSDVPGHDWEDPIPENRAVICESTRYGVERKAVYRGRQKLIRSEADDVTLTAAITSDGESFENFSDETVDALLDQLPDDWVGSEEIADTSEMVQDQLEALGYQ